jgi:hypothetical protein
MQNKKKTQKATKIRNTKKTQKKQQKTQPKKNNNKKQNNTSSLKTLLSYVYNIYNFGIKFTI